jgi:hypothetical protein
MEIFNKRIKERAKQENTLTNDSILFKDWLSYFIQISNIIDWKKREKWYENFIECGYLKREGDRVVFLK